MCPLKQLLVSVYVQMHLVVLTDVCPPQCFGSYRVSGLVIERIKHTAMSLCYTDLGLFGSVAGLKRPSIPQHGECESSKKTASNSTVGSQ